MQTNLSKSLIVVALLSTLVAKSQVPTLYTPADNATNVLNNVSFSWSDEFASGALSYELQRATNSSFTSGLVTTNISGTPNLLATLTAGVTYYWRVRSFLGGSSYSSYSTIRSFTMAPSPVASFTATPTTVCAGSQVSFNSSASTATNYSWSFPGGTPSSSTAANPTVTYNSIGVYNVTLTAITAMGSDVMTKTNYISVVTNFTPTLSVTQGNPIKCPGDSVELTAGPSGAGYTYLWSNSSTTPSIKTTQFGTFSVTITNSGGCKKTLSKDILRDTLPIYINTPKGTAFCYGDSIQLIAIDSGYSNFLWSTNANTQQITIKQPSTYTVTATDAKMCARKGSILTSMAYANKKISITGYASSICNTDSIILTAPAGFTTYNWSNGKLQSQVAINTPGFYSVIFTDSAGCKVMDSTTLLFTKGPCYEGIYTIGGVNPDFLSVKAAMDSLNKYRIKGKVTFRIRNGVYNDRLVLHSIKGASLTNNVTFESESGFAPKVVITADDTLLYLDNVSFLTIKNITFKDTIHERFIYCPYTYGTYLNFIENNFIGNGDDNYYYTNRSNTIVGFTSSHYGVYFTTSSAIDSSSFVGNVFSHTFSNILFYTIGYSQISNNKFSAYKYALVLANGYYCTISGNKVEIINGNEGISCSGSYLSIFNNRVICKNPSGSPSSVSALRIASGNNNKIYNNDLFSDKINNGSATLNITGKSCFIAHNNIIGSPAFYFTFTNNDSISVINNNFGLPSGGNILLTFKNSFGSIQAANIKEYKNNNYHGIDSTFDTYKMVTSSTTNYKTYSSWKNAQIFDNDSRFIDPKYISQYVLTPTNKSLNNTAEFSPEVQTDISGNWRNSPKTDIGSYEINTFKDLMVDSVFLPTSACIISGTTKIRIRNNSLFFKIYKNDSVRVSYSINGVSQPSSIFNFKKDSLDYYDTAIVSLPPLSSLLNTKVNDLKFWINYYSDSSSCNDTLLHTFYFPIPQVDFSSSGVCTGTNILFTSQTSQVIAYKWSFPDGSSAITPNAVSALNPGTNNITLQVTNMEGCNNSITKPIIIYNLPSNAVIRNGDSLIADTGLSYRWFLNNVALPADTFQKVKIKQSGNYKVVVTSPQGCVNTSSNAFYAATGINKLSLLNEVLIYPVPTKSAVQIEFSATEKIKYTLTDITGKVVQTGNFTNKYNELNLSFLKSGIYIISLQDTLGQTTTRKIVKE